MHPVTVGNSMDASAIDAFGTYLRKLREKRGVSAEQLTAMIFRVGPYVDAWERRRISVNRRTLMHVCQVLGLSDRERHKLLALADERLLELAR